MTKVPKLIKKIVITGETKVISGLLIGSSSSALEIGGVDKQVIRNPLTNIPYIPGSSLKGKMRSLMELNNGTMSVVKTFTGYSFGPTLNPDDIAARLFGYIKDKNIKTKDNDPNYRKQQPSRIIVRDGSLTNDSEEQLLEHTNLYTETKAENAIDRITSEANPRFFERVPAGARFDLSIVLNVFDIDIDNDIEMLTHIFHALQLVQDDYLGGCGSRGNGRVEFYIKDIIERTSDYYTGKKEEKNLIEDIKKQAYSSSNGKENSSTDKESAKNLIGLDFILDYFKNKK